MFITNNSNLPEIIVRAVSIDNYHRLGDISASSISNPIQQFCLQALHSNELVEDASARIYSFLGTGVHAFLANIESPNCIKERPYVNMVNGMLVSCTIDLYENRKLYDFKVTSVYAAKKIKPEHITQLNVQRYLMFQRGRVPVEKLYNVCILRDWSKMQAFKRGEWDYPKQQVVMLEAPVWSISEAEYYIRERVDNFTKAKGMNADQLYKEFPCSKEDKWEKAPVFAVMPNGKTRAVRGGLHDSMESAKNFVDKQADPEKYFIQTRRGEATRCLHYCSVRDHCKQHKEES